MIHLVDLRQTDTGIYFFHDYVPLRKRPANDMFSERIYQYKLGDEEEVDYFTGEIMHAIAIISQSLSSDKIGLVAVPPSKVDKESSIRKSIYKILSWYREGITKSTFGCNKAIYEYANLLTRNRDIPTAHKGIRPSYDEQKDSITCMHDRLSRYWTTFIILDDITTTGRSMDVCRDILIENGALERYIYRMAIGRTI